MTPQQYDPIPDLAALIDGLQRMALAGNYDRRQILGALLTGPYARLRGGLLLDEPDWDTLTTEEALRETLRDLYRELLT